MPASVRAPALPNDNPVRRIVFVNEANEKGLKELVGCFTAAERPVAFIGAGVSARSGYPTWTKLIDALLEQMATDDDVLVKPETIAYSNDVLWKASACRAGLEMKGRRQAYLQVLRTMFAARPDPNPLLDAIVSLPFAHFLTTNYDPSIHLAYRQRTGKNLRVIDAGLPATGKRSALRLLNRLPDIATCIHLHGLHSNPRGIILTEDDYRRRYISDPHDSRDLARFLEKRAVVFFGFSLEDADFMRVLRTIRSRAKGASNTESVPNFAFLPLSDGDPEGRIVSEKQRLSEKYRIRPVFFRRLTEDYAGLENAVRELLSAVTPPPPPAPIPERQNQVHNRAKRSVGGNASDTFVFSESARSRPVDPEDPNKGAFGGSAERNGRRLGAMVRAFKNSPDWFRIDLTVSALDGSPDLPDDGVFYVHPSFPKDLYRGQLLGKRVIRRKFWAYGAFTVGALVDRGKTALELDLSKLPGAPKLFRSR